jgi:hypothetical protein
MPVLQTSRVAIVEPEVADLERVYASLDIPGHRIELLDGQVTVSPTASRPHSRIVQRLQEALWGRIDPHGDAYRSRAQADAGKALVLPDPFGIELDVKDLLA